MRVLIAYATKNGSTAGIAEAVAQELTGMGIDAEARPAASVRAIREYDAVLLGSAIYLGRWRKEALRFGRRFALDLLSRPVWLFDSGPLDSTPDQGRTETVAAADELAREVGAKGRTTFGGRLREEEAGFFMRRLMRGGRVGRYGDFRNLPRVRQWAHGVGAQLLGPRHAATSHGPVIVEPTAA